MNIKSLLAAALFAVTALGAQAAPQPLTLEANGTNYSTGLSTQAGSNLVTFTQAGEFRDEFLIQFNGWAYVNAMLDTSADLGLWATQGVTFTRAGFVNVDGSELTFESFDLLDTRFQSGYNLSPFLAHGDFIFFVEGVAGDTALRQSAAAAQFNSFSYSGTINLEAADAPRDLPEPASLALAALALAGAGLSRRRRAA